MGKKIRMLFVWKAFFGGLKPFLLNGGALGYRPDLFGDESPTPIIFASRRKNKYKTIKCGIQEPPVLGMVWGGAPIVSAF